jgi:uncharacterized membrane protein YtjA (UPF0391 family)
MGRLPPLLQTYSVARDRPFFRFCSDLRANFPTSWRRNIRFRIGLVRRPTLEDRGLDMLGWVVTFLIIALIAGILGFGGIAGASIEIAKIIFFIAVVLFLVSAIIGVSRGRRRI